MSPPGPLTVAPVVDPDNLADNWAALTPAEQSSAKESMEYMGIHVRRARRILKSFGGGKYLRRGVGAALALNFECSSLEEAAEALKWCRKNGKNKDLPLAERIEMMKTIAPLVESIRRMCESSLAIGKDFDAQQKAPAPTTQTVQLGVSINNFPPVAPLPPRMRNGVLEDNDGDKR